MADERTYTAVEHVAILETEVKRETVDLRAARESLEAEKAALAVTVTGLETEKAELLQRIDKLDAEKAAAEKAKADTETELAEFKASVEREKEIAALRETRTAAVKAELVGIGEEYFTPERAQRWAEMSAEQFTAVLADLSETTAAMKKKPLMKDGKPVMGKDGNPMMVDPDEPDEDDAQKAAARETAAFKGGADPGAKPGSTFLQLIAASRSA